MYMYNSSQKKKKFDLKKIEIFVTCFLKLYSIIEVFNYVSIFLHMHICL